MNISTVANNLRNTIAGKEALLANYSEREEFGVYPKTLEYKGICDMLVINVAELTRILQDVEACCEESVYNSWAANPDRSGGSFTAEEINNQGWK